MTTDPIPTDERLAAAMGLFLLFTLACVLLAAFVLALVTAPLLTLSILGAFALLLGVAWWLSGRLFW